jgi:hypothetical protein
MKKLIIKSLLLVSISFYFTSCERLEINELDSTEGGSVENVTKNISRGYKACVIEDGDGNVIAAGTRCGTPTGDCGPYSKCKALTRVLKGKLPDGMTFEEFAEIWNDDTRRERLISLGYNEKDIE